MRHHRHSYFLREGRLSFLQETSEFLYLALEFIGLMVHWIWVAIVVFITSSLVGVATTTAIIQPISEILVTELTVQMITQIIGVATFRMKGMP